MLNRLDVMRAMNAGAMDTHQRLSDRLIRVREVFLEAEFERQLRLAMGVSPERDLDLWAVKRWIKRHKAVWEIGVPEAELVGGGDGLKAIVKERPPRLVWEEVDGQSTLRKIAVNVGGGLYSVVARLFKKR